MNSSNKKDLFILGHMRSRSSLLNHLILSDSMFVGLGESNAKYDSKLKFHWMKIKAMKKFGKYNYNKARFVDQINHNFKTPNDEVLNKSNLQMVLLARPPMDALTSIQDFTSKYYSPWSLDKAREYYQQRIEFLIDVKSQADANKCFVINSDHLIDKTQSILDNLSTFLSLNSSLKNDYSTYDFTGNHGDPSENLKQGRILKMKNRKGLNVDLAEEIVLFNTLLKDD